MVHVIACMEGIKDYKFTRLRIGQNCKAMSTNKGGHRDVFLNKRRKVPRSLSSRPTSKVRGEVDWFLPYPSI